MSVETETMSMEDGREGDEAEMMVCLDSGGGENGQEPYYNFQGRAISTQS